MVDLKYQKIPNKNATKNLIWKEELLLGKCLVM